MEKTTIRQQEDALFAQWEKEMSLKNGEIFVSDGVVCPAQFKNIVFIMKEVHSKKGETKWDLRDKIMEGKLWRTWNNVARWTAGIDNNFEISWDKIDHMNKESRLEHLSKIASMNVKKTAGKPQSKTREIEEFGNRDRLFLEKQLGLYDANYVICCGKGVVGDFLNTIFPENTTEITTNHVEYRVSGNRVLIFYYHPNPRFMKKQFLYENLKTAFLEIEEKRKSMN